MSLRGVVVDLSGLRDRGPGFKTRSQPLTFTKAVTEFQNPTRCGVLNALTNSSEFRHTKDVKTLELTEFGSSNKPSWHKMDVK
jgi:hypothetical protein